MPNDTTANDRDAYGSKRLTTENTEPLRAKVESHTPRIIYVHKDDLPLSEDDNFRFLNGLNTQEPTEHGFLPEYGKVKDIHSDGSSKTIFVSLDGSGSDVDSLTRSNLKADGGNPLKSKETQFSFTPDQIIIEANGEDRLRDTTICKVKQRFIDIDSKQRYYKFEVINIDRYIEHYRRAEIVESDYETKETWSSEEIKEWQDEDWGTCPAFSVDHRPKREPVIQETDNENP